MFAAQDAHYDVVVVGAGAASCAMLDQLLAESEVCMRILVLEAGPLCTEDEPDISKPSRWTWLQGSGKHQALGSKPEATSAFYLPRPAGNERA